MKKKTRKITSGKRYCCVPDMVLSMGDGSKYDKQFAMEFLSQIYDKNHKKRRCNKK